MVFIEVILYILWAFIAISSLSIWGWTLFRLIQRYNWLNEAGRSNSGDNRTIYPAQKLHKTSTPTPALATPVRSMRAYLGPIKPEHVMPALVFDKISGVWRVHSWKLSSAIVCNQIPFRATSNIIPLLERQLEEAKTEVIDHHRNCQFILQFMQAQILSRDGTRHAALKHLIMRSLRMFSETPKGDDLAHDALMLRPLIDKVLKDVIQEARTNQEVVAKVTLGSPNTTADTTASAIPASGYVASDAKVSNSQPSNPGTVLEQPANEIGSKEAKCGAQLEFDVDMTRFTSQLPLLVTANLLGFLPRSLFLESQSQDSYALGIIARLKELADSVEQIFAHDVPLLSRAYQAQRGAVAFTELVAAALWDLYGHCACSLLDVLGAYGRNIDSPPTEMPLGKAPEESSTVHSATTTDHHQCHRCEAFVTKKRRLGDIPWPPNATKKKPVAGRLETSTGLPASPTSLTLTMMEALWNEVLSNRLDPIEMAANMLFLVTAGYETTSSLMNTALICRAIKEELDESRTFYDGLSSGSDSEVSHHTAHNVASLSEPTIIEELSRVAPPVRRIYRQVHRPARVTWVRAKMEAIANTTATTASVTEAQRRIQESQPVRLPVSGREIYALVDTLRRHAQSELTAGTGIAVESSRTMTKLEYGFWVVDCSHTDNLYSTQKSDAGSFSPPGCVAGELDEDTWRALEELAQKLRLRCQGTQQPGVPKEITRSCIWAQIKECDFVTAEVASSNGVRYGANPHDSLPSLVCGLGPDLPFAAATSVRADSLSDRSLKTTSNNLPAISSPEARPAPFKGLPSSLSFGVGVHNCPGKAIALAETTAVMSRLLRKVSRLRLRVAVRELEWIDKDSLVALSSLPMRITLFEPLEWD